MLSPVPILPTKHTHTAKGRRHWTVSSTERRKNCAFLKHSQLWNLHSRRTNLRTRTSLFCRGERVPGKRSTPTTTPTQHRVWNKKIMGGRNTGRQASYPGGAPPESLAETILPLVQHKITRELDQNRLTCCVSRGVGVSLGVGVDVGMSVSLGPRGCERAWVCICCYFTCHIIPLLLYNKRSELFISPQINAKLSRLWLSTLSQSPSGSGRVRWEVGAVTGHHSPPGRSSHISAHSRAAWGFQQTGGQSRCTTTFQASSHISLANMAPARAGWLTKFRFPEESKLPAGDGRRQAHSAWAIPQGEVRLWFRQANAEFTVNAPKTAVCPVHVTVKPWGIRKREQVFRVSQKARVSHKA